jgi:glycosyltransferase involved in cell wall biosynthesis
MKPFPPFSEKKNFDICILTCLLDVLNSHTQHYANSLEAIGFNILVMCPGNLNRNRSRFTHIGLPSINHHFMPYRSRMVDLMKALYTRGRNSFIAAKYLFQLQPRVIMCSELDGLAISVILKPVIKCKIVADVREIHEDRMLAFPRLLQRPLTWLLRQSIKLLIYGTDEVVHMNKQRQLFYNYCSKAGVVVSYYPQRGLYNWAEKRITLRCRKEEEDFINVVQAGPLRLSYAGDELIQAIDKVSRIDSRIRCFVLGGFIDALSQFKHHKLLHELQTRKKLVVTPLLPLNRVVGFLKIADIGINLVKPIDRAHMLAQPRKLYEYLAAGLPVVGSNVPTIAEVITECKCGEVVDPGSPEEIAAAILALAQNRNLRRQYGANALNAASLKYCWETQEKVFHEIFKRLTVMSN